MESATLNRDRRPYLVAQTEGFSCLGFDNARDHANRIAMRLGRPELAFSAADHAALIGCAKYLQATHAWGRSRRGRQTHFDPGTEPEALRQRSAAHWPSCRVPGRRARFVRPIGRVRLLRAVRAYPECNVQSILDGNCSAKDRKRHDAELRLVDRNGSRRRSFVRSLVESSLGLE
jgi:hypothetical protein